MIVCANCGANNRNDERFCGNCGAFLEWEGTAVDRGTAGAGASRPAEAAPAASSAVDAPAAASAGTGAGTTSTGTTGSTGTGSTAAVTEVAPEAPVASPERPSEPVAVQPGLAPRPRRPVRPIDEPRPAPSGGEKVCPKCRSGNDTARRFCRNCGTALDVQEEVTAHRSWWQRLIDRLSHRNRPPSQRRGRAFRRILMIITALCLLAIAAVGGPPLVNRGINEIRDRTKPHVPLTASGTNASSAGSGSPAARLVDGAVNRYWAPTGAAAASWVEVSFASPVRVLEMIITPGISKEQDKFLTVGRPDQLDVVATKRNGQTVTKVLRLRDQPGPQTFKFQAPDVVRLRLVVRSTYGPPRSKPTVAIGEAEFFGRR